MPVNRETSLSYRRLLPHLRSPGGIYHVRFSVDPGLGRLSADWMFEITEYSILYHHKIKSLVFAYVIMPNHAHLVLQPLPETVASREFYRLEDIMRNLKGYSGWMINKRLKRKGQVWVSESFDRIIRDDRDLDNVIDYIHHNPVRWG